jgi:DNA processing protein
VVAIVGTRRATAYAERVTRQLASTLARAGATVISGLARGVDAAAHRGALEVGGATVAVLGTGLDVCYPKGHAALQREIGERGLLLSELAPDDAAHPGSFPRRNRIIAALARVTIVVEAGVRSGALITAAHALEMNRGVAAVPGPIDVPQAQGSNELLRDGASVIASMADALALLGLTAPIRLSELPEGTAERTVWDALDAGGLPLESLAARASLPAHEALAAVTALELRGLVECALTGEIRRM